MHSDHENGAIPQDDPGNPLWEDAQLDADVDLRLQQCACCVYRHAGCPVGSVADDCSCRDPDDEGHCDVNCPMRGSGVWLYVPSIPKDDDPEEVEKMLRSLRGWLQVLLGAKHAGAMTKEDFLQGFQAVMDCFS